MSLYNQITIDIKEAMKAKDALLLDVLRMVSSELKNLKIATKKEELIDDDVVLVLSKEVKKRKDAIKAFEEGGRNELAEKEKKELKILNKYLPKQLSEEEVKAKIKDIVKANPKLDFGPLMGKAMAELKGKADGNIVQKVVKEILST